MPTSSKQKMGSEAINLQLLERTIGHAFGDTGLVTLALSHRSVGKVNNERLEFLGDSLLNLYIADALFRQFPQASEGDLSRLRAHLVRGETLAQIAQEMQLGDYLLLGGGELKSGGFRRKSILADTVEALIGAIYLDSDIDHCRTRVLDWYRSRLDDLSLNQVEKDPKTRLQEYLQERGQSLPDYQVVNESGQSHAREYEVRCRLPGITDVFTASASSKRKAEKLAAADALRFLGVLDDE